MTVAVRLNPLSVDIVAVCEWADCAFGAGRYRIHTPWPVEYCEFEFYTETEASAFALRWIN